ncbi:hypothetical protein ACFWP5_01460 [Streptomyces sp. NPDC058469]|uniref:hypothetical protein n=1 Tax=Streptomyces sp. NPDC058469 TaxID=3346514 RepID=UPI00364B6588
MSSPTLVLVWSLVAKPGIVHARMSLRGLRYFRTKADVVYLDLHNAVDEHLAAVDRRLSEGHDAAGDVAESSVEILNRFIADEDNKARVVRSFRSPNFDARSLWTGRWSDRLAGLLRAHLPESDDRDLRARTTATVCLNTVWAAVQQWAEEGLDEPLEPILRKAFGLATAAARDAEAAVKARPLSGQLGNDSPLRSTSATFSA